LDITDREITSAEEMDMLGNKDAAANIAVKNMETARKFYEGTLGLKQVGAEGKELIAYRSGNSTINVYRSKYARHQPGDGLDVGGRR
jgi:catechol 2,3-dioxygenase-like lactoylglutathione lyase family enzyme